MEQIRIAVSANVWSRGRDFRQFYRGTPIARQICHCLFGELYGGAWEHSTETQGEADAIDARFSAPCESCPASPLCIPIGRATSFAVLWPDRGHPWLSYCLWMI
jgi:hypothetical protein